MRGIEYIVRALICVNDNILVCCDTRAGNFFLPGGHIEEGETPFDALKREIREETNRDVLAAKKIQTIDNEYERNGEWVQEQFEILLARLDLPDNIESRERYLQFLWIALSDLEQHDFRPPHIIPDILATAQLHKGFWL